MSMMQELTSEPLSLLKDQREGIMVPESALQSIERRHYVWLMGGDGLGRAPAQWAQRRLCIWNAQVAMGTVAHVDTLKNARGRCTTTAGVWFTSLLCITAQKTH